jgi:hypothetical protein
MKKSPSLQKSTKPSLQEEIAAARPVEHNQYANTSEHEKGGGNSLRGASSSRHTGDTLRHGHGSAARVFPNDVSRSTAKDGESPYARPRAGGGCPRKT